MNRAEELISIMQEYLSDIRKIAGWSAETLGKKIGVTKQTISNLENYKVNMTKMQYIAIRAVIEYEIRLVSKNSILERVIDIIFCDNSKYSDEKKQNIKNAVNTIAAAASGGLENVHLSVMATAMIAPLGVVGNMGLHKYNSNLVLSWLEPIIND